MITLAEQFLLDNKENYLSVAASSDLCAVVLSCEELKEYDLLFSDGSRLRKVTETTHAPYISLADEYKNLIKSPEFEGVDFLKSAEIFGATEIVDMLIPDKDGDNYHNVHFADGSCISNISKNELLGETVTLS